MIKEKNKGQFKFVMDNGLIAETPAEAKVYVHFTDTGIGKHAVNGRVFSKDNAELGWIRTDEAIQSNSQSLIEDCHQIVLTKLQEMNPNIEFVVNY